MLKRVLHTVLIYFLSNSLPVEFQARKQLKTLMVTNLLMSLESALDQLFRQCLNSFVKLFICQLLHVKVQARDRKYLYQPCLEKPAIEKDILKTYRLSSSRHDLSYPLD